MSLDLCRAPSRWVLSFAFCALLLPGLAAAAEQLLSPDQAPGAPSCALTVQGDAGPTGLDKFLGQVVYVDFWASWCGPCRMSFPFMNELQAEFAAQGLVVLAVNLDEEAADAQSFLDGHPASFKVATGTNQECATGFHVEAMPSSYLIDRAGRVRYIHHGFRAGDAQALHTLAATLIAEPTTP
jgi:thiol-disulfide isomerase/thioredoxin